MAAASTTPISFKAASSNSAGVADRISSVDVLRGLVMVIMALDHTRDFFSSASFDPTDLDKTTALLFFTRWITHFCAPVFVFLAGSGAFLSLGRGKGKGELSRFLLTRGLWLVALELLIISPTGWSFSLSFATTRLQVIWVIGVSMIILAGLIQVLSSRVIGGAGIAMIVFHNLFDGAHAAWLGPAAGAWKLLHQVSFFKPFPHTTIASLYPLIPWVGVMMAGYGAGELLTSDKERRRRILFKLGAAMTAAFVILRATNLYGDPSPWAMQSTPLFTVLSFLRCSKYPPSLLYLLMTLGPALVTLALLDGARARVWNRFRDFGRVPLFYYLLHLPILHGLAVVFSFASYGRADWLYQDLMALRGSLHPLPAGYGYGLPVVYAVWLTTVIALYPLCRWFAGIKKTRREAIFSYL